MIVVSLFRSDLAIKSKETALEFYKGVKSCIRIPYHGYMLIRVEPGNLIGVVTKEEVSKGYATFVPNLRDDDGSIAYRYRKYINAYLKG